MIGAAFRGVFIKTAVVGYVYLTADNRFDTYFFARRVEINHAVEGAVVGDGKGVHPKLFGAGHQVRDTADAIQHAVLSVNMKVREHLTRLPPHKMPISSPHHA